MILDGSKTEALRNIPNKIDTEHQALKSVKHHGCIRHLLGHVMLMMTLKISGKLEKKQEDRDVPDQVKFQITKLTHKEEFVHFTEIVLV